MFKIAFIEENLFRNSIYKVFTIFSRHQYVDYYPKGLLQNYNISLMNAYEIWSFRTNKFSVRLQYLQFISNVDTAVLP